MVEGGFAFGSLSATAAVVLLLLLFYVARR